MEGTMKDLIESLHIFWLLTRAGFYFSGLYQKNSHNDNQWGFVRFNYVENGVEKYSIFDIDFEEGKFWHVHADKSLFRIDLKEKK
jgi:hypothetical protein